MSSVQSILYPTDFSECSDWAFPLACSLASKFDAGLTLVHVYDSPTMTEGEGFLTTPPDFYLESLEEKLRQYDRRDPSVSMTHLLVPGDAAEEILRAAKETNCRMIVMGAHGRTGLQRLFMGSVAEKVRQKADCPVVTVKTALSEAQANDEIAPQALNR